MPPNTKCVTRPGRFGNPFYVDAAKVKSDPMATDSAASAVASFEDIVNRDDVLRRLIRRELRGFNLACYCHTSQPCHADVLLRIANE